MLTVAQSILLGIVQGATEWLPISSSGHLVLLQKLLGVNVPVVYDISLHVGTLFAALVVFWKDILRIVKSFVQFKRNESFRLGIMVLVASLVTAAIGFSFLQFFKSLFVNVKAVGIGLILTGAFLVATKFFHGTRKINLFDAVVMGIAQGVAIAPGVSRSGMTIASGLIRRIDKSSVVKFSFLISIVAVMGAQIVELKNIDFVSVNAAALAAGVASSALAGYISIKFLLKTLLSKKFYLFAIYCFAAGLVVLLI